MLLFYSLKPSDPDPSILGDHGVTREDESGVHLWKSLEDVSNASRPIIVVNGRALPSLEPSGHGRSLRVSSVPREALQNVSPYRPPRAVTAAGGYVTCFLPDGDVAILLIYRRGLWDLPKGTRDPGEDIVSCARREVREEVGVEDLDVSRPLGTTRHGYERDDHYVVKTTHWYLMRTPERSFEPDRREGIRRVARARWDVARDHVGYQTLRDHMDLIESKVRNAVVE